MYDVALQGSRTDLVTLMCHTCGKSTSENIQLDRLLKPFTRLPLSTSILSSSARTHLAGSTVGMCTIDKRVMNLMQECEVKKTGNLDLKETIE